MSKAVYYPEHNARIATTLTGLFPETLEPNYLLNVILDIIRGGFGKYFTREETPEAVDQLVWAHLKVSKDWK